MINIAIPDEYLNGHDKSYLAELVHEFIISKTGKDPEYFGFTIEVCYGWAEQQGRRESNDG